MVQSIYSHLSMHTARNAGNSTKWRKSVGWSAEARAARSPRLQSLAMPLIATNPAIPGPR